MPLDPQKIRDILSSGPATGGYAFDPLAVAEIEAWLQQFEQQQGLQDWIQAEYDKQQGARAPILERLQKLIEGGPSSVAGLSPEAMAALRGRAIESVPERFDVARRNLGTSLARRGLLTGQNAAAGDTARLFGNLAAARERTRSEGLRDVTLSDEEARARNFRNLLAGYQTALAGMPDPARLLAALARGNSFTMPSFPGGGYGGGGAGTPGRGAGGGGAGGGGAGGGGDASAWPQIGTKLEGPISFAGGFPIHPGVPLTATSGRYINTGQPLYASGVMTPEYLRQLKAWQQMLANPPLLRLLGRGGPDVPAPAPPPAPAPRLPTLFGRRP